MQPRTKVRRRVLACARCRKRKLSCDGKVPACTRCVDAGVQCQGFDSATQREAPRSLADFLEAHIATLEGPRNLSTLQRPSQPSVSFPSPPDSSESDARSRHWGTEKSAFADSLVNQAMEDITPGFLGVSKARPLLQCVVRGTQLPSRKGPVVSNDLNENHPRSILNPQPSGSLFHDIIPDEVGANQLFQNYLDRVITQYPIYHRNDVTTAFNSIYHRRATKPGEDSVRNRYIICIIMAISLSTAARSKVRKANELAFQLVRHAMQWIPDVATNDIPGLQATLLLTQYIFLNPRMADLWLLTGLISQAVIDLGLHQELPNDARVSAYQRDMRRRLFWCAWEMEVGVCCIFLRPTSLPIRNIEVAFPLELDDTAITRSGVDRGGRVSKFTQRIICRFRLIEAEIVSVLWHGDPIPKDMTIHQWEQQCIEAMSLWRQEIYASAHANKDPSLVQRWKEMTLYSDIAFPYILVTLYRPSRYNPAPTTGQTMVALDNAVKVADGYFQQSEAEAGRIKYVFHPCHHVFNCALIFLQGVQRCKQEVSDAYSWQQVEEWMNVFAKCFSSIAERWAAAQRCLDEYDRLLAPVKKEYLEFLEQKASLQQPLIHEALPVPDELHGYHVMGPSLAPAEIDDACTFWTLFNPTTTSDTAAEPSAAFVYNVPRDWNAEFSLNFAMETDA
ncbi:fungal-specific transcription factor domain-containing protein [Ampelomyces quisqualis]|uniref:Fungal-specific transcription factor domain-containing protein n=1 Tax=Ampelomyces quisqualis TaxID=50730 RepID=A0A6A5QPI0_AMPQU|nr:fungal-specific transcription factor domain-containing protein [Ampelomyces quisqualis]